MAKSNGHKILKNIGKNGHLLREPKTKYFRHKGIGSKELQKEISVKKISEQLDISEKAVEYHITKSQKILKEKFKDFYSAN